MFCRISIYSFIIFYQDEVFYSAWRNSLNGSAVGFFSFNAYCSYELIDANCYMRSFALLTQSLLRFTKCYYSSFHNFLTFSFETEIAIRLFFAYYLAIPFLYPTMNTPALCNYRNLVSNTSFALFLCLDTLYLVLI